MADEVDTTKGETSGGETDKAASNDPNINEYGISLRDWDDMSQGQQRDIAHSHGDDWHGQPPPTEDSGESSQGTPVPSDTSTPRTVHTGKLPTFQTDAQQEAWLADQREMLWEQYERERKENVQKGRDDWKQHSKEHEGRVRSKGRDEDADRLREQRESQESWWSRDDAEEDLSRSQDRSRYVDRPSQGGPSSGSSGYSDSSYFEDTPHHRRLIDPFDPMYQSPDGQAYREALDLAREIIGRSGSYQDSPYYVDTPNNRRLVDPTDPMYHSDEGKEYREALNRARETDARNVMVRWEFDSDARAGDTVAQWVRGGAQGPPSQAELGPATGPNAAPMFGYQTPEEARRLSRMKSPIETWEEYREHQRIIEGMFRGLDETRARLESRGELQFEGESDEDFEARRAAYWEIASEAIQRARATGQPVEYRGPQSQLSWELERLNAQGLSSAEFGEALDELAGLVRFEGTARGKDREWLAGQATFFGEVGEAVAEGRAGTPEALEKAIDMLGEVYHSPDVTPEQRAYLDLVIEAHADAKGRAMEWVTGFEADLLDQGLTSDELAHVRERQGGAITKFEQADADAVNAMRGVRNAEALDQHFEADLLDQGATPEEIAYVREGQGGAITKFEQADADALNAMRGVRNAENAEELDQHFEAALLDQGATPEEIAYVREGQGGAITKFEQDDADAVNARRQADDAAAASDDEANRLELVAANELYAESMGEFGSRDGTFDLRAQDVDEQFEAALLAQGATPDEIAYVRDRQGGAITKFEQDDADALNAMRLDQAVYDFHTRNELSALESAEVRADYFRAIDDYQQRADLWEEEQGMGAAEDVQAMNRDARQIIKGMYPETPIESIGVELTPEDVQAMNRDARQIIKGMYPETPIESIGVELTPEDVQAMNRDARQIIKGMYPETPIESIGIPIIVTSTDLMRALRDAGLSDAERKEVYVRTMRGEASPLGVDVYAALDLPDDAAVLMKNTGFTVSPTTAAELDARLRNAGVTVSSGAADSRTFPPGYDYDPSQLQGEPRSVAGIIEHYKRSGYLTAETAHFHGPVESHFLPQLNTVADVQFELFSLGLTEAEAQAAVKRLLDDGTITDDGRRVSRDAALFGPTGILGPRPNPERFESGEAWERADMRWQSTLMKALTYGLTPGQIGSMSPKHIRASIQSGTQPLQSMLAEGMDEAAKKDGEGLWSFLGGLQGAEWTVTPAAHGMAGAVIAQEYATVPWRYAEVREAGGPGGRGITGAEALDLALTAVDFVPLPLAKGGGLLGKVGRLASKAMSEHAPIDQRITRLAEMAKAGQATLTDVQALEKELTDLAWRMTSEEAKPLGGQLAKVRDTVEQQLANEKYDKHQKWALEWGETQAEIQHQVNQIRATQGKFAGIDQQLERLQSRPITPTLGGSSAALVPPAAPSGPGDLSGPKTPESGGGGSGGEPADPGGAAGGSGADWSQIWSFRIQDPDAPGKRTSLYKPPSDWDIQFGGPGRLGTAVADAPGRVDAPAALTHPHDPDVDAPLGDGAFDPFRPSTWQRSSGTRDTALSFEEDPWLTPGRVQTMGTFQRPHTPVITGNSPKSSYTGQSRNPALPPPSVDAPVANGIPGTASGQVYTGPKTGWVTLPHTYPSEVSPLEQGFTPSDLSQEAAILESPVTVLEPRTALEPVPVTDALVAPVQEAAAPGILESPVTVLEPRTALEPVPVTDALVTPVQEVAVRGVTPHLVTDVTPQTFTGTKAIVVPEVNLLQAPEFALQLVPEAAPPQVIVDPATLIVPPPSDPARRPTAAETPTRKRKALRARNLAEELDEGVQPGEYASVVQVVTPPAVVTTVLGTGEEHAESLGTLSDVKVVATEPEPVIGASHEGRTAVIETGSRGRVRVRPIEETHYKPESHITHRPRIPKRNGLTPKPPRPPSTAAPKPRGRKRSAAFTAAMRMKR